MTSEGRNRLESVMSTSGLTWQSLASRLGVNDRRRMDFRPLAGRGHRRESGGNASLDPDGRGG